MTQFGVHTGLQNTSVGELSELWRTIEDAGFGWISIWDHFYAADLSGGAHCLEAVSMHAALAATTERVRCGSLVYSIGYRHPAVLANAMASIDHLSGGRVTVGMGAGWCEPEYAAYGIPFPRPGIRLAQLAEGVECVRRLLDPNEEAVDFSGQYFTLTGARCEPVPVQAHLPVWIGGGGEKVTLRIAAEHADGWNVPFLSLDDFRRKVGVLGQHADAVGRDPSTLEKGVNLPLAWTEDDLERQFGAILPAVRPSVLTGSTQEVVDRVGAYADAGADWIILAARAPFDVDGILRFAEEVIPNVG